MPLNRTLDYQIVVPFPIRSDLSGLHTLPALVLDQHILLHVCGSLLWGMSALNLVCVLCWMSSESSHCLVTNASHIKLHVT